MWMQQVHALAAAAAMPFAPAAAMPFAPAGAICLRTDIGGWDAAEVAAPFDLPRNVVVLTEQVQSEYMKQKYIAPSSAELSPVSFVVDASSYTTEGSERHPTGLVQELKRLSGLTWSQIADIFDVSARAPYHWASGNPMSAENHQRLGEIVSALKHVDRGSGEANRNLLLSDATSSKTYCALLHDGLYDRFRELAGAGAGRPSFARKLTSDSEAYNAPPRFGHLVEAATDGDEADILPQNPTTLRRTRARA